MSRLDSRSNSDCLISMNRPDVYHGRVHTKAESRARMVGAIGCAAMQGAQVLHPDGALLEVEAPRSEVSGLEHAVVAALETRRAF